MVRLLAALVTAALLVSGCSGKADDTQGRADCSASQAYNPFEQRCVSSDFEVCRAWINGGVDAAQGRVTCQVDSDGAAWVEWGLGTTKPARVTVKDGANVEVYANNVDDQDRAKLTGTKGRWTLTVEFGDNAGAGEIYLWG